MEEQGYCSDYTWRSVGNIPLIKVRIITLSPKTSLRTPQPPSIAMTRSRYSSEQIGGSHRPPSTSRVLLAKGHDNLEVS